MPRGIDIHGAVLRELRDEHGWTADELARRARAIAKARGDRQFALDKHQICRYETGRKRPSLHSLEYMLAALRPSVADVVRLLKPSDPLYALLKLTREANDDPPKVEESPPMDRREFGLKLPVAVAVHVALPSPADPLRAEIDEVIGAYAASSPQRLLPQARHVLDKITRALREPMMDGVRRRLLVDASEVATVAARMALFGGHPGESHAYFVQAREFADASRVGWVRGCALWQTSLLHDLLLGDGDSRAAHGLLQAAAPLVGSDGLAAKAMAIDWADHCAALERDSEAMRLLERADRIRLTDDGEGYYSLRGGFAGYDEQQFAASRGTTLARLGRTDEALDALRRSLAAPNVNIRTFAVDLSDIALAHTKGGDPEPACQAAIRSLNASKAVGYTVGEDRILRVRDMMPPEWTPLVCVRELDERLGRTT